MQAWVSQDARPSPFVNNAHNQNNNRPNDVVQVGAAMLHLVSQLWFQIHLAPLDGIGTYLNHLNGTHVRPFICLA